MAQRYPHCDPERLRLLLQERLPVLEQSELMGHLDHCQRCQQTLEGLAADKPWWDELRRIPLTETWPKAFAASTDPVPPDALEPELENPPPGHEIGLPLDFLDPADDAAHLGRLGPFVITEVLGRGGMGIVFQGIDVALNRPVAIKVLAPYFASSGAARKRFAREAQAAAAVVHEHVVAIHGVDTWKGLPYLVMSFVNGHSLQERLDTEGPLGVREILRIGMQTASGLAAAHAQGLVHRDVKPANILLENGIERVKLTDFGLARAVDDASLTQSGVIAGTPQYMAPEQAAGETVDHRADLFSLGSVLYAMCTGHPPFRADSAMAVLRRVCDERPRPVRSLNPDVPIWLAAVIERMLAKKPADRFQTAEEVADLLGNCLAHSQQPDTHPLPQWMAGQSSAGRAGRLPRRLIGVFLLLALGALTVTALCWKPPSDWFPPAQETAEEGNPGSQSAHPKSTLHWPEDGFRSQMDEARQRSQNLEAQLRQPVFPSESNDSALPWLREAQQRLDKLERELGGSTPVK
jgi:serine/threonine protein kinase